LSRIREKDYTDNVVDLLVGKFSRMPADTQDALKQLACLGNNADFTMLKMIYQDSNEELERELWEAVLAALSSVRKIPIVFSTTACRKRRIP